MSNKTSKDEKTRWIIEPDGWYIYCSNCYYEPDRDEGLYPEKCKKCGSEMYKEDGSEISEFEKNYGKKI